MTRKELNNFKASCSNVKQGYCCYQNDGIKESALEKIGTNSGVCGWNWTCYYYPETDTCYISGYRNY